MPFSHHEFDSTKICLQLEAMASNSRSETTTIIGTKKEYSGSEFDLHDIRREKAFELVLTSLGRKKRMDDGVSCLDQIVPSTSFKERKANGSFPNASLLTPKSVDLHLPCNELSKKKVIEWPSQFLGIKYIALILSNFIFPWLTLCHIITLRHRKSTEP